MAPGLRERARPVTPFHWEIEFPKCSRRENGGFDAVIGNPPFLGGKRISTIFGEQYRDWLSTTHEGSNNNADLVTSFFRRSFDSLRVRGASGLIATNTVSQGDSRKAGLGWSIARHGGVIFFAERWLPWPSNATVTVSIVHFIQTDDYRGPFLLDGGQVGKSRPIYTQRERTRPAIARTKPTSRVYRL